MRRLRQAVSVQEQERARIARDLHDHLGQQITALRLLLARHAEECPAGAHGVLDTAMALAREIDLAVDELVWELRPAAIDSLGLAGAVRQLVDRWSERAGVRATCRCDALRQQRLSREAEHAIYRIVQEALQNVQKHARASRVEVTVEIEGPWLVLAVRDDGTGFDPADDAGVVSRAGLPGMRERAALAGALLEVTSSHGDGTAVVLRCPAPGSREAAS